MAYLDALERAAVTGVLQKHSRSIRTQQPGVAVLAAGQLMNLLGCYSTVIRRPERL